MLHPVVVEFNGHRLPLLLLLCVSSLLKSKLR
jgi:hypothetical protein